MKMVCCVGLLLLVAVVGCYVVVEDGYDSLWEEAYARGEGRIFSAYIDSHSRHPQSVVWVSASGYPQNVAVQAAKYRGLRKLGRNAYTLDVRVEYAEGYYYVDVLMAAP